MFDHVCIVLHADRQQLCPTLSPALPAELLQGPHSKGEPSTRRAGLKLLPIRRSMQRRTAIQVTPRIDVILLTCFHTELQHFPRCHKMALSEKPRNPRKGMERLLLERCNGSTRNRMGYKMSSIAHFHADIRAYPNTEFKMNHYTQLLKILQ